MVGRWGFAARRIDGSAKLKRLRARSGPASPDPPSRPAPEPCFNYFSAALRAVFRFRRRASAAFKALASLGFT